MPKKVKVVDLQTNEIEQPAKEQEEEPQQDEVSKIKEEIHKEEEQVVKEPPKRKTPIKKIKEIINIENNEDSSDISNNINNTENNNENINISEKNVISKTKEKEYVECPKCHKTMLKKSFRYNHENTCQGKPREELPIKKRTKKEEVKPEVKLKSDTPTKYVAIPEEVINEEIKKRVQQHKEKK